VIGDSQLTRTVSRNISKAVTLLCNHCETVVRCGRQMKDPSTPNSLLTHGALP